jgi:hypothetical protein
MISQIIMYVVAFNLFLSGLKKAVDAIKDSTPTTIDDKASTFLGVAMTWLGKIIDMIGYNPSHDNK